MDPLTTLRLLMAAAGGGQAAPFVPPRKLDDLTPGALESPDPQMQAGPAVLERMAGGGLGGAPAELPEDLAAQVAAAQERPVAIPPPPAAEAPFRAPRRFRFQPGIPGFPNAGGAEEWKQQLPPDDSPSDNPPPRPGMAAPRVAQPADGGQPSQEFQDANRRMDFLAQRLALLNRAKAGGGEIPIGNGMGNRPDIPIPAARRGPAQFYDSQPGIRGEYASMLGAGDPASNMPGGLLEMRLKRLQEKPEVAALNVDRFPTPDENAQILNRIRTERLAKGPGANITDKERIARGWSNSIPTIRTPDGKMAVKLPDGQMVPVDSEDQAKAVAAAYGRSRSDAWQQTMAGNEARDKQALANRPGALSRIDEHTLFRESPKAWMAWKMMGGGDPEQPNPFRDAGEGGGYDKMAMMAQMSGDPQSAKFFGELFDAQGRRQQGQATVNLAAAQHYGQEMGKWEQAMGQWRATLTQARDAATKRLVERSGDPKYLPSNEAIDAEVRRINPDLLSPPPRPWMPGNMRREWGDPQRPAGGDLKPAADADLNPAADIIRQRFAAAHPEQRVKFVLDNHDQLIALSPGEIAAIYRTGTNRKALIKAVWDALKSDHFPALTITQRKRKRAELRDLLSRLGVPPGAMPGAPGYWRDWTDDADSPGAADYYKGL